MILRYLACTKFIGWFMICGKALNDGIASVSNLLSFHWDKRTKLAFAIFSFR
jgi:hypothetical protein